MYLPFMIFSLFVVVFCAEKKLFWGRTFLIGNRFSKIMQQISGQSKGRILQKKIFDYELNEIENVCEIPLSETRNHTLIASRLALGFSG